MDEKHQSEEMSSNNDDAIRSAILARAQKRWRRVKSPSLLGRLLATFFGGSKLEGIVVFEYDDGNIESLTCEGNVVRAWLCDEHGLREVDPAAANPGEPRRKRWPKHLLCFYISPDKTQVVANELEGPEHGNLILFRVKGEDANVSLKVKRAALLLGGTAIG